MELEGPCLIFLLVIDQHEQLLGHANLAAADAETHVMLGTYTGPVMTYKLPVAGDAYLRVANSTFLAHKSRLFSGDCGTMLASEKLWAIACALGISPAGAMWPR